MYQACIFCSGRLGGNESIESFPVGRRLAFDPAKGRLWVVCPRCNRWNLAPIEERWEPVEEAERLFRSVRTRVHSENIGLASLPDGTRLARIGQALEGELAAWRYGRHLTRRRARYLWGMGGAAAAGIALVAGMPLLTAAGIPLGLVSGGLQLAAQVKLHRDRRRPVLRLDAIASPTGRPLEVRQYHLWDATLHAGEDGLAVRLPDVLSPSPLRAPIGRTQRAPAPVVVTDDAAARLVRRGLVFYNERGGTEQEVARALAAIHGAGSAEAFARALGGGGVAFSRRPRQPASRPMPSLRQIAGTFRGEVLPVTRYRSPFEGAHPLLSRTDALALEMALSEATERAALEGELAELAAAWREAEEIAAIADALPDPIQLPPAWRSSSSTAAGNEGTRGKSSRSGSTTS